ncbi:MAG TPA: peptidoglycan-binding domain-containing protein [Casimicrobiaceae bacterium]|nr:peptidoglycan-binding domain-containing protein [Casimicrobiaceae bacterium]
MNTHWSALLKAGAVALLSVCAGCATWNSMDRNEKGTATGATGGALIGAAVGGPVGALVGAGAGGYAGYYETQPGGIAAKSNAYVNDHGAASNAQRTGANVAANSEVVRDAQRALNDRGFNAGEIDGRWGPNTEQAVLAFQRQNGLPQTGTLDERTLATLGVNR